MCADLVGRGLGGKGGHLKSMIVNARKPGDDPARDVYDDP